MSTSPLEDLLAEFWSRREAGEALTADGFVDEHPEHAAPLRSALASLLQAAELLPGSELPATIAGYHVERLLGRGAIGEVFAVRDHAGRELALKRLLPHVAMAERARQRLGREANVLHGLRHPGIVEIVAVGEDHERGGMPFLVMERVEGRTLAAVIDEARRLGRERAFRGLGGPGSVWQQIARLMAQIARAVAAAHGAGILHRDLKPSNVLLRVDGTPVVIDFGLAADAAAATLTGTGDLLGTPHYMAPEQANGQPATEQSDIFGLGAILYEVLTLRPPRQGADALQVLTDARRHLPRSPAAIDASVPRELDLVVRRAMAFRACHRHGSAGEFAHALELIAVGGRPIGLTLSASQRVDEFWRRRRYPVLAVVAVVVALVGASFVMDLQDRARVERLRAAMVVAGESHVDGDRTGVEAAAQALADNGGASLAAWLRDGVVGDDAFVVALATGHGLLAREPKSAMAPLQRAVELRPDAAIASAWLGIAALRAEAKDVAERELTAAVRGLPGCVRLHAELGRLQRQQGKAGAACQQLSLAVELPRADAETWHEFAKALMTDGQQERALTTIDRAIDMATKPRQRLSMVRTKAVLLDGMKRSAESLPLLAVIVKEAPTTASWRSYGMVLDKLHRIDEAAAAYRHVLELDPKHMAALVDLIHVHSGSNPDCAECRAYFQAHPELLDAKLVDDYAMAALRAEDGTFEHVEIVAEHVHRMPGCEQFRAAVEQRLQTDLPAEALGHLLRASKLLRGN